MNLLVKEFKKVIVWLERGKGYTRVQMLAEGLQNCQDVVGATVFEFVVTDVAYLITVSIVVFVSVKTSTIRSVRG